MQILVLTDYIKPRTVRFPRLQVTMTHNQRFRITLMQIFQQTSQRTLLRIGSGVAGSLAVMGKSTHVSHPDRVSVMVFAMRPHHLFRPPRLNGAVGRNHIVVAAAYPSQRTMIAVDVRHPQGTARPVGGAAEGQPQRSRTLPLEQRFARIEAEILRFLGCQHTSPSI